jgi:hypothetical protein
MSSRQVGLPSQPTSYLKYPEYDWLWLKFCNIFLLYSFSFYPD